MWWGKKKKDRKPQEQDQISPVLPISVPRTKPAAGHALHLRAHSHPAVVPLCKPTDKPMT